jgi:microcompartment protein CcmL/EutN
MYKAIGLVEYKSVYQGMASADAMVKTAEVDILEASTVCPGKFIVLLRGSLSAVNAAVERGLKENSSGVIDSFILGNPHDSIFQAISGASEIAQRGALGVIETFSAASIIVAADAAVKSAEISLVEIRVARGMCGKSYLLLTGEVAAVEAAVENGCRKAIEDGMLVGKSVIANPDPKLWKSII